MTDRDPTIVGRRQVLGAAAAAAMAWAGPGRAAANAAPFRRWGATDPSIPPRVLDSYRKGVAALLRLRSTGPRNWYRHAMVHVFDCPHGNWWFLPWPRAYLGWFEETVRNLSGDEAFALPYWDWTKDPRVPAPMFDGVLDPHDGAFAASFADFKTKFGAPVNALWTGLASAQRSALAHRGLATSGDFWAEVEQMFFPRGDSRGLTRTSPWLDAPTKVAVGLPTIKAALGASTFAGAPGAAGGGGFASAKASTHSNGSTKGVLESQPHDNVHGAMGGTSGEAFMVSFLSPVDPIFFMHHANLDRLWDVWTRRQAALVRPSLPTGADLAVWSAEPFLFFHDGEGRPAASTAAGDYASMTTFKYDYSPGSGEDMAHPAAPLLASAGALRSFEADLGARTIRAGAGAGGTARVPESALRAQAADAAPRLAEVTLDLNPADQGKRFRVTVSVAGGAPIDAGAITVFNHHAHGPTTFTVPLPPEAALTSNGDRPVDVRVEPIEAAAPQDGTGAASPRRARLRASAPVQVSGVRIVAE